MSKQPSLLRCHYFPHRKLPFPKPAPHSQPPTVRFFPHAHLAQCLPLAEVAQWLATICFSLSHLRFPLTSTWLLRALCAPTRTPGTSIYARHKNTLRRLVCSLTTIVFLGKIWPKRKVWVLAYLPSKSLFFSKGLRTIRLFSSCNSWADAVCPERRSVELHNYAKEVGSPYTAVKVWSLPHTKLPSSHFPKHLSFHLICSCSFPEFSDWYFVVGKVNLVLCYVRPERSVAWSFTLYLPREANNEIWWLC